jgi:hypothetical protein
MNDRCFEDHKRSLEKLKSLVLNTLYLWIAAYISPLLVINYHDILFFLPLLSRWLRFYIACVHGGTLCFFMISRLFIKKGGGGGGMWKWKS